MCRHLAYLGPPVALRTLLFDAPHSLSEQAARPLHQAPGRVNKDGWGVGWYSADGTLAGQYRTVTSMWDDSEFTDDLVTSGAFLAAARLASPGATLDPTGNAPFRVDPWLFSLNGYVKDFREGVEGELRAALSERRRDAIVGDADTEVVFALVLDRLDAGDPPGTALADVIKRITAHCDAKLNLLLTDGRGVHATRYGNSLFARATTIASEALDEEAGWEEIPEKSVVHLDADGYRVTSL